jgi:hypothetical protein
LHFFAYYRAVLRDLDRKVLRFLELRSYDT